MDGDGGLASNRGMSGQSKSTPGADRSAFDPRVPIDPSRALVPAVVRVNEQRVARGFWPKIRTAAARIPFAKDVVSLWFCARDPQTPAAAKGMMLAGLAYFVLPADAIPDVLAAIGYSDDAAVIATLMALIGANVKPKHREAAEALLEKLRRQG